MSDKTLIPQMQPWLGVEEANAAAAVILDNWISEGPKCAEFSSQLNSLIEVPYGVFAPNGTFALILGLMALGIEAGDEVLVPNITFIASANALIQLGATPVFVEVERETFQIDVTKAEHLVNQHTKAIMPVHLYGSSCNMNAVINFASKHRLLIIEDAAQGIGVKYYGKHVGGFGDVGCFSFFADKTITTGEGGYVVCKDKIIYEKLCFLRNQGRLHRGSFLHPEIGYNFRITDIQAAIGLVQLAKLSKIVERKTEIMSRYVNKLSNISQVRILGFEPGSTFVPFRCVLIADRAHELMIYLEKEGISARGFFIRCISSHVLKICTVIVNMRIPFMVMIMGYVYQYIQD